MENGKLEKQSSKVFVVFIILTILILAFFLRIVNIENIPYGIYSDEAQNGVDAQLANINGKYKVFYETNNGREGLFINILALSIKIFGNTVLALKLPSIIFGTFTVLGLFLLIYEIFNSYSAAMIGAYFLTFSYWAINFSRIAFRAIMVPFVLVFVFYFIFRGLRTKNKRDFFIAGLFYGIGFHTYIAYRASPLCMVMIFVLVILTHKNFLSVYWTHTSVFLIGMLLTSIPILLDLFYIHPEHNLSRISSICILNNEINEGNFLSVFLKTIGLSIQKYFLIGDLNIRHNYAPFPMLNPILGIFFLIGLAGLINKFIKSFFKLIKYKKRDKDVLTYGFLLAWFFVMLIPEFMAYEGNPHALRAIGTLPVVIIISSFQFMKMIQFFEKNNEQNRICVISVIAFVLLFIAVTDFFKYFVFFGNSPRQYYEFDGNIKEVAYYIKTLPPELEKIIILEKRQKAIFEYFNPRIANMYFYSIEEKNAILTKKNVFILIVSEKNKDLVNSIIKKFPDSSIKCHKLNFGEVFYDLKVNSTTAGVVGGRDINIRGVI